MLERALARGVVDEGCAELPEALAGADLVYIALPVGLTIERLAEIARHVRRTCAGHRCCSTKRAVCAAAEKHFSQAIRFLGGHPMAGSEDSGIDAADASLFQGAKYALMAGSGDDASGEEMARVQQSDARIANFVHLIEAIGARPIWIDAATHDRAAALVSHLPQLVSMALAGVMREATDQTGLPLTLAGRGLRDALRLAGSPYSVWRDIVLTNTDNLDVDLDRLSQAIEHLRAHLRQRELEEEFSAANDVYKMLRNLR